MSLYRLRTDFQFAIVLLFGVAAVVAISPFAVYRALRGEWFAAAVESVIVALQAAMVVYLWRGGKIARAASFMVISNSAGCALIGLHLGLPGAFWAYTTIVSNFLMVGRRQALVAAALLLGTIALGGGGLGEAPARMTFLISGALSCLFAYIFAHRTEGQRRQLEELASHDALTGLFNRRAMETELAVAAETMRRHRTPVAVAVLDIDHFKQINDGSGHETGDRVLTDFARILRDRCRAGDRLFRYGGEEFVALLPRVEGKALERLLEDLRRTVAAQLQANGKPVTVSIGAAQLRSGETVIAWLARADAAMYHAKRMGRDRVVVAKTLEDEVAVAARA